MGKITRKELGDELNNELDKIKNIEENYSTKEELQDMNDTLMSHLAQIAVDAKSFGVIADGVFDNSDILDELLNYASSNGYKINLPSGKIGISRTFIIDKDNIIIQGQGRDIKPEDNSRNSTVFFKLGDGNFDGILVKARDCTLNDFTVLGNNTATIGSGVVVGFYDGNDYIAAGQTSFNRIGCVLNGEHGFNIKNGNDCVYNQTYARANRLDGFHFEGYTINTNANTIINLQSAQNGRYGLYMKNSMHNVFTAPNIHGNVDSAFYFDSKSFGNKFIQAYSELNGSGMKKANGVYVSDNIFLGHALEPSPPNTTYEDILGKDNFFINGVNKGELLVTEQQGTLNDAPTHYKGRRYLNTETMHPLWSDGSRWFDFFSHKHYENLLSNGDFKIWDSTASKPFGYSIDTSICSYTLDGTCEGGNYVTIKAATSSYSRVYKKVPLNILKTLKGKTVTASVRARKNALSPNAKPVLRMYASTEINNSVTIDSTDWKVYKIPISIPIDATTLELQIWATYITGAVDDAVDIDWAVITTNYYTDFYIADNDRRYSNTIPTKGVWEKGEIVYNSNPTSGGYIGWICVSGDGTTLGTWKGFGLIES